MGFSKYMRPNDKSMEPLSEETLQELARLRASTARPRKYGVTPHHDPMPDRDGKVTTRSPMIDREDY